MHMRARTRARGGKAEQPALVSAHIEVAATQVVKSAPTFMPLLLAGMPPPPSGLEALLGAALPPLTGSFEALAARLLPPPLTGKSELFVDPACEDPSLDPCVFLC